jgi:wobble nucleotide-excising tRNase
LGADGRRTGIIGPLDPLLEQYDSEYHYLFKRVHEEAQRPAVESNLESHYSAPNTARRLVETFLAFRYPDVAGGEGLTKLFDRAEFDAAKKARILRFLHTYSHSDGIPEPEHDPSVLSETKQVLGEVLEMIETLDATHYAGMRKLVAEVENEA